jgi:hypothetical protein
LLTQLAAKTGLSKYPGVRHRIATIAILEMLATACAKGVYQSSAVYRKWALDAYRRAWKEHAKNDPYEDPPDDLLKAVSQPVTRDLQ